MLSEESLSYKSESVRNLDSSMDYDRVIVMEESRLRTLSDVYGLIAHTHEGLQQVGCALDIEQ